MIGTRDRSWEGAPRSTKSITSSAEADHTTLSKRIIMLWLLGTVVLLPMEVVNLPLNMTLVDYWFMVALPVLWILIIRGRHPISLSYALPILLIFGSSFASAFISPKPSNSLIVIVKEIYLFMWFITLAALLSRLSSRELKRFITVWISVTLLHGLLIIAQFLSPDFWWKISAFAGRTRMYEFYRPSGLFLCDTAGCANSAAYFQLLGFVPLLLAGFSSRKTTLLGILLFASMLVTGSMGANLSFMVGLFFSVVAIVLFGNQLKRITNIIGRLVIIAALLGGVFFLAVNQNQRYQEHIQSIILGRADRSSEGRFGLWQRGINLMLNRDTWFFGIGPENFRVVDSQGKQLHNDLLAFTVERGLLGALGLVWLGAVAIFKALNLFMVKLKSTRHTRLVEVVFLAAIAATLFESLTHQIFHDRQLWLVLALMEAMVYRTMVARGLFDAKHRAPGERIHRTHRLLGHGEVSEG